MNLQNITYKITSDPSFQDELHDVTPQLKLQFESLYLQSLDSSNKTIIDKLIQMVIKHPYTPQLKNYLSGAYFSQGNIDKANEVTNWILKEHPSYLYAILNKAEQHILKEDYELAKNLLGDELEINNLYPNRNLFHTTEILSYYSTVIHLLAETGDVNLAENKLKNMLEIDSRDPTTKRAASYIAKAIVKSESKTKKTWFQKQLDKSFSPSTSKVLKRNPYKIPKFNHQEILLLYRYELDIPKKIIENILNLPRITLIEDLVAVIDDAEYNYEFYRDRDAEFKEDCFLLHAIMIFGEMEATEILPKILEVFKNDNEFLEFYFSDYLLDFIWQSLYKLEKNQHELLADFLKSPNIATNAKILVANALEQNGQHNNKLVPELNDVYEKIIDAFLDSKDPENLIDNDFLSFIVIDSSNFNFQNLVPKIKELYKRKWVSKFMSGDWKECKNEFAKNKFTKNKIKIQNIFSLYENNFSSEEKL